MQETKWVWCRMQKWLLCFFFIKSKFICLSQLSRTSFCILRPKIDSILLFFFLVKRLFFMRCTPPHPPPPLFWVMCYHTFSHGTFLALPNFQKHECSCFRWKLPLLVLPAVQGKISLSHSTLSPCNRHNNRLIQNQYTVSLWKCHFVRETDVSCSH